MMRLFCNKASFGNLDMVAICWTKGDKLVPPGAKVGDLASGCGNFSIPDLINVMIYMVDERKDGKGMHEHGERITLSSSFLDSIVVSSTYRSVYSLYALMRMVEMVGHRCRIFWRAV